jgi:hypothetical protein
MRQHLKEGRVKDIDRPIFQDCMALHILAA